MDSTSTGAVAEQLHSQEEKDETCKHFLAQNSTVVVRPLPDEIDKASISSSALNDTPPPAPDSNSATKSQDAKATVKSTDAKTSECSKTSSTVVPPLIPDFAAARQVFIRYKCDICGRICPSKHKLKRHLSTHSEARPFPCPICGRSFKWTEYLQKHMRQQHSVTSKGTFVEK